MKSLIRRARRVAAQAAETVPGKVVRKFAEDGGPNQAVLLAWNTLTSIFPIALALAAILGLVLHLVGLNTSTMVYSAVINIIPGNPDETRSALDHLQQQTGVFFLVGLAGLIWSGSSLFGAMEQAFDLIYHVEPRSFVRQKLMAVAMILLFTVLAGFAVTSSSLLPLLKDIPLLPSAVTRGATVYVVTPLAGVASGVVLFGAMYYVVPNRRQRLREVWPGALLAGAGFYALTLLFPVYIALNKGIGQYGKAFAFLLIVTTFFYLVGLLTMLGVELNAVLYPIPVEQPDKAERLAPAQSRQSGERLVRPARGRRAPEQEPRPAGGAAFGPGPGPRRSRVRRLVFAALGSAVGLFAVTRQRRRAT